MNGFYKFIRTFLELIASAGSLAWEHVIDYKYFLWRLTKWFALFAVIPFPVLLICLIFGWHVNWLYSAYFIFVGAEAVILMVLAFPIIVAAQIIFDKFPQFAGSIRKSVQIIAAVAFWALMLAVYFYVFPVWENPKMIPLVLMAAAALALGAYAGWVRLPTGSIQRFTTVFLVSIFLIATFAFSFPNRTRQLVGFVHKIDEAAFNPNQVRVESPDQIQFVTSKGVPQIWYYRSPTGEYELYDQEGFHRSGARLKLAETTEERNQIITWFRDQAQRTQEEMRKTEERRKQLGQQQAQNVETPQPNGQKKQIWVYPDRWTMLPTTNMVNLWLTPADKEETFLIKRVAVNSNGEEIPVDPEPYENTTVQPPKFCAKSYLKASHAKGDIRNGILILYENR